MNHNRKKHWEQVYQSKTDDQTSWFQPSPQLSLELIKGCQAGMSAVIIDVGGGTSRLIDALLGAGYRNLNVLDISAIALQRSQARLGPRAAAVNWMVSDATDFSMEHSVNIWHDRAVFHFLTDSDDQQAYLERLNHYLLPGGHLIIAAFSPDGPKQCSGLDIVQYDSEQIQEVLGSHYKLVKTVDELHKTPAGGEQHFNYFLFKKVS